VNIVIEKGLFTTIIGPNGAGKTTFFNLISGLLRPTGGQVLYKGTDVTHLSPVQRVAMGMGRSFQLTNVFPALTVQENVRLALQAQARIGFRMFTDYRKFRHLTGKTEALLEQVLLQEKKDFPAANLTHGEQRKLELAMVLALEPEVLLLDEPTAGMALEEVPTMFDLLAATKKQADKTIVLIEHKMDLVTGLSDQVIVLVNGAVLAQGSPAGVAANPAVLAAYLGGGILSEARA
jgi:branched-chain amino acid transport system ATP-binding protein